MSDIPGEAPFDGVVDADFYIASDPARTWRHRLQNQWRSVWGCVCSGSVMAGTAHIGCVLVPAFSGAATTGVLPADKLLALGIAPLLSTGVAYAADKAHHEKFTLKKAFIAASTSLVIGAGLMALSPHDHDREAARAWLRAQPESKRKQIEDFARATKQTPEEVAINLCESDPSIRAAMEGARNGIKPPGLDK